MSMAHNYEALHIPNASNTTATGTSVQGTTFNAIVTNTNRLYRTLTAASSFGICMQLGFHALFV